MVYFSAFRSAAVLEFMCLSSHVTGLKSKNPFMHL